ncbi:hypothetical protein [Cyanobium sp. CH-040]|uniref:hypothetical protein n=1 Tax=Cyanobium sp. CH-040 TaxID=2823708 RepID=UPI0020CCB024|nr:hypothetical protein [Cyanobium sp. CH-040]MCP9927969.1 hypothetical protein [Cyanobium sp. CH-040]
MTHPLPLPLPRAPRPVRPRPPFLRALGRQEPPVLIEVEGRSWRLERVFKHDSWAATALYRIAQRTATTTAAAPFQDPAAAPAPALVCKFNRQAAVFGLPLAWLGPLLARREAWFLESLAATGRVPRPHHRITTEGRLLCHAVAHDFVDGEPLSRRSHLDDRFFPALRELLEQMHARGLAYVDLHKMENVLVGPDGLPWLIDFQVSFALARRQPWRALGRPLFKLLRSGDTYHLMKHWIRLRPQQCGLGPADLDRYRPRWIRWHRRIGVPLRRLRRQLLVWLGVRDRSGHAHSEEFAEDAIRRRHQS